ncbi:hypothetical protein GCM10009547_10830 [Sporichthya brevicatena]|uniref:Dolichyl-phosphate-mannose-protein mannosyltransferase n=1 Tax=Sporichthya brevicatena TaxID=171442 RepID=A0ABN1GFS7_9ACTN
MRSTAGREPAILAALFWVPFALAAAWIVASPPHSVDGPAHLLGARAIADHGEPVYARYYELDWFPTPNLAGTRVLAVLVDVGGLRLAATVMLLLAALGTPLALRYALRAIRPESTWLAIAALPLCFGYLYFYGFWNYCLGTALALACVGLTLRAAPAWRPGPTLALAALLTLTWLTHLVPFVAAVLFLGATVVTGPRRLGAWLAPAATVLPGAVLSLAYLLHTDSGDGPTWTSPLGRVVGLVSLHTTVTTYSRWEDVVAAVIALVLVTLALVARRAVPASGARAASAAAGLAATAAAVLVLATPASFGLDFGLIDERLAVFPVLFALLWLAARPPEPRIALIAAVALVVATGALALVRLPKLADYDDLAAEYLAAGEFVEPGSTLVALRFANLGPDAGRNREWDPTRHLASELAARRHAVDVGHYEAVLDYFPARFRPEVNPRTVLDPELTGLGSVPPQIALAQLPALAPVYVLVVGAADASGPAAHVLEETRLVLARHFEKVGTTGRGLVEVWRSVPAGSG